MILGKTPSTVHHLSVCLCAIFFLLPADAQTWRDTLQYAKIGAMGITMDGYVGDSLHNAMIEEQIRSRLQMEKRGRDEATYLRIHATYLVTTTNDTGIGSLRKALEDANLNPGLDLISFNIPPSGPKTIVPLSFLPNILDPIIVDGTTQPGYVDKPMIELNFSSQGSSDGIDIFAANCAVRGLVINRVTGGSGIVLWTIGGSNVIEGNYFGTDLTGTVRIGMANNGVTCISPQNRIGGTTPAQRNIFAGQGFPAIALAGGSFGTAVKGNFVGTDVTGTVHLGTASGGIVVNGSYNDTIGGIEAGARNLFASSENNTPGIGIIGSGLTATIGGTQIVGNYIGTDITGAINFGNAGAGILVRGSPNNVIGGTSESARNVISGNRSSSGIYMDQTGSTNNTVRGNFIGVAANGIDTMGNGTGITIDGAPGNTIGGFATAAANVISGSFGVGVVLANNGATGNTVQGNAIGTNLGGFLDLGNGSVGIYVVNASGNQILTNIVAHNKSTFGGIYISGGTRNTIVGNSIYQNTGLGIDLAPPGLARNDSLDGDAGANDLLNFPLLDSLGAHIGPATIHGRYNGKPNSTYTIHFYSNTTYDPSHFGEGQTPLSETLGITTDASGRRSFSVDLTNIPSGDQYLTATATDTGGNTSEFSQALCLSDTDADGIMDSWETQGWGIDVNSDSLIDLDLAAMQAHPNDKDVFVEVDAMQGLAPQDTTLQRVADAFAVSPNGGINLHITISDTTIPQVPWQTNWWARFDSVKKAYFGTQSERNSSNARFILEAKRLVYRYCIFAFQHTTGSWSGTAEENFPQGCDDFMITLGTWTPPGGDPNQKAGTFMHELGHTLGLHHGGGDDINYKPNYISIMGYTWQTPYKWANTWRLNYSEEALSPLVESSLDEFTGLNVPLLSSYDTIIAVPYSGPGKGIMYAKLKPLTMVDWDSNGTYTNPTFADLNIFADTSHSPGDILVSQEDWSKLIYNFRNSPDFSNALRSASLPTTDELDFETFQFLDNLPPPKPTGQFVMDGQLDTSAILLASNAGINLYARYKSGQLYVATNSAQSQGADMFIFIADARNPRRGAPGGKSGQVAAWTVYLANESTDNSSGWSNATETPLTNITVDTAGTVLEGVIDIELLYGRQPAELFIAAAKYGTNVGGSLIAQNPVGNGDGNIDPQELLRYTYSSTPLNVEFVQQGSKLVGSTNALPGRSYQGASVAVSSDGNTAVVGGRYDYGNVGAMWVFTRNGGVWTQQGEKLVGTGAAGNAEQGWSVSISSDGNTALVGGQQDANGAGAAWVFTRSGGVWTQQGIKLVGAGATGNARQGRSVSISSDGNTAVIGGNVDNGNVGAAWVFTRNGGIWTQQGNKLVGTGYVGAQPSQGISVAISGDGNTLVMGGPLDDGQKGAAWVFTRSGGMWTQQGNKLVGTGAIGNAVQGSSVGISSDGNAIIVGGPSDNVAGGNLGAAWVFIRGGETWTQLGSKLVGTGGVNPRQGASVSISGNGNTAIVGANNDDPAGAAWVFTRSGATWTQLGSKLVGTGTVLSERQGWSVAMSSDGNTAIVGGPDISNQVLGPGATWVFSREVALPITLASFTVNVLNQHDVRLDWVTLSEINNYGFEAQRKPEGQPDFQTLQNSFVPGHGTTNEPHSYSYIDTTVAPGQWHYRLKQIDLDGTIHYGPERTVSILTHTEEKDALPKIFALHQNYPDPFNPSTTIRYELPAPAHVTLKVYNVIGQEVVTLVDAVEEAGHKSVTWNAEGIASGVYFYRIVATSGQMVFTDVMKMLVLR